jgi:hypothetical protein
MIPSTWEQVHAGDVVLGHDGQTYGVADIAPAAPGGPIVTLYRHGARVGPAQPPPGTPIVVVRRADTSAEAHAFSVLAAAGVGPEVIRESYQA